MTRTSKCTGLQSYFTTRDRFVDQEVAVYHTALGGAMWERRPRFYTVVCLGRAETQPLAAAAFTSRISVERFPWGLYTRDVERAAA